MKIFKDIFSDDEIFSDTYKYKLVHDVVYEVRGKYVTRKQGEIEIEGFNPSAEEASEGSDDHVERGIDIVLNHRLQPTQFSKKDFMLWLKGHLKQMKEHHKIAKGNEEDEFNANIKKWVDETLPRFKDFEFYTGENADVEKGTIAIVEYRDIEGTQIPILMAFKHALLEEKF